MTVRLPLRSHGQSLLTDSGQSNSGVDTNASVRGDQGTGNISTVGQWQSMRQTNPTVATCLRSMFAVLQSVEFDVKAHEQCPHKITELIDEALFEAPDKPFTEYAESLWKAVPDGFAPHEIILQRDDGRITLKNLGYRPAQTIETHTVVEMDGWIQCEQRFYENSKVRSAFFGSPGSKDMGVLLWSKYGGTSPLGESILRPIWYLHLAKVEAIRIFRSAVQRAIAGIPHIYPKEDKVPSEATRDATAEEVGALIFHEQAAIVLPEWVDKVEYQNIQPESISSVIEAINFIDHQTFQTFAAQWIARGISTGHGTNAANTSDQLEQQNVRRYFLDWLSRTVQPLINWLVDLNFGKQKYYPYLDALYVEHMSASDMLDGIKKAVEASAIKIDKPVRELVRNVLQIAPEENPDEDIEPQYDKIDGVINAIKKIGAGKDVEGPVKKPVQQGDKIDVDEANMPEFDRGCGCHLHSFDDTQAPGVRKKPQLGGQAKKQGPEGRPLSPIERLVDWRQIELTCDSCQLNLKRIMIDARKEIATYIVEAVSQSGLIDQADIARFIKKVKIPKNLKQQIVKDIHGELQATQAVAERTIEDEKVKQKKNVSFSFAANDDTIYNSLVPEDEYDRAEADAKHQLFQATFAITAPNPQAYYDLLKEAASELDATEANKSATLVSTEAFSKARDSHVARLVEETSEFPKNVWYSSVLDKNRCVECERAESLHGQASGNPIQFGSPEHSEFTTPYQRCLGGAQCRCILIYEW